MRTSYCEKQEADVEEGELLGALALSPEEEGGSQPLPALGLGSVSESYWSRRLSHSLPAPHPTARALGAAHGLSSPHPPSGLWPSPALLLSARGLGCGSPMAWPPRGPLESPPSRSPLPCPPCPPLPAPAVLLRLSAQKTPLCFLARCWASHFIVWNAVTYRGSLPVLP